MKKNKKHVSTFDCVTCHNLIPSLTIRMDDGNQYFEKIKLCPKSFS